jgi:hypothetical protein
MVARRIADEGYHAPANRAKRGSAAAVSTSPGLGVLPVMEAVTMTRRTRQDGVLDEVVAVRKALAGDEALACPHGEVRRAACAPDRERLVKLELDQASAARFVATLTGSAEIPITLQTFVEADGDSSAPRIIHAPLAVAWPQICDLQSRGHGVFVMVNEGDLQGRSAANVTAPRALFYDADKEPWPDAAKLSPPLSMVVSSGRGQHGYGSCSAASGSTSSRPRRGGSPRASGPTSRWWTRRA